MKTKEELNALKAEAEALYRKLADLTDDELEQIASGLQFMDPDAFTGEVREKQMGPRTRLVMSNQDKCKPSPAVRQGMVCIGRHPQMPRGYRAQLSCARGKNTGGKGEDCSNQF